MLPYLAVTVAVVGSVYRYYTDRYSVSSQSSQLLESRSLSWGSVPWHYGIITILGAHVIAAVFPSFWSTLIGNSLRLYVMEITGWALAVFLGVGLAILIARRWRNPRIWAVSSVADWVVLACLGIQVVLGLYVAVTERWGATWYLFMVVPWLQSLVSFNPNVSIIVYLPLVVELHILNALILIMLIPFTRLIHMFTFPVTYLWRPYQVVVWNRSTLDPAERAEKEVIRTRNVKIAVGLAMLVLFAIVAFALLFSLGSSLG